MYKHAYVDKFEIINLGWREYILSKLIVAGLMNLDIWIEGDYSSS
jgi:hypothetical protein